MPIHFKSIYRFYSGSLLLLACLCLSFGLRAQTSEKQAILQAAILVQPVSQPTQFQTDKVQPGHSVKISLLVENVGNIPSPPGRISIRFALAKPLDKEPNSILFETEQVNLPAIQPASSLEIAFEKTHKWPALPDFIREDWNMREYQAVVELGELREIIGSLAITFSAYYYPGIRKELPVTVVIH